MVQAFARAAKKENKTLEIIGVDISSTAPALFFCDKRMTVPRISSPDYIPELLRICEENKVDLVIPMIDTDLLLLAGSADRFREIGTAVLLSDVEKIRLCRDKRLTESLFHDAGLNAPRVYVDVGAYDGGFPAFIKPSNGSSSINAFRVDNQTQLEAYAAQIDEYIIQPFIDGEEYTVDVFCDFDGKPVYITPRRRLSMRSGEVIKTKIEQDERIIDEIKQLIAVFEPRGPITVQLIRERETGEDWFIEINPRYGGGAPTGIDAGADSPAAIIKLFSGEKVEYTPNAAHDGALYLRFDQSIRVDT